MVHSFKWVNRDAMLKRGVNILLAHWRNRILDNDKLSVWFKRTVSRYGSYTTKRDGQPTDWRKLESKFWLDCENTIRQQYGIRD